MSFFTNTIALLNGQKTYLASAVLAFLGVGLLWLGDGTLGSILLANSGGLAALRHALARLQTMLHDLDGLLPPLDKDDAT